MNTKLITPILALCCLPLSAKVYTVKSLSGNLVVNIDVDKSITWEITKGKTQILKPSVISLQTDKQTFGVNPKVRKAFIANLKNDDNGGYQQLLLSCNGYDVVFRVFQNAAAYRIIPKKMINKVINETSEYRFAGDYLITAKPKAHAFKNEMCFPLTKTKCELKKHPNSKFECFFNDFNRTKTSLFLPFPSKLIQDNLVCVLELQE